MFSFLLLYNRYLCRCSSTRNSVSILDVCLCTLSVCRKLIIVKFTIVTLRASCGAVYCNRLCLWVCLFVGVCISGSVTTITRLPCYHEIDNSITGYHESKRHERVRFHRQNAFQGHLLILLFLIFIIDIYFHHCFMCLYGCSLSTFIKLLSDLI